MQFFCRIFVKCLVLLVVFFATKYPVPAYSFANGVIGKTQVSLKVSQTPSEQELGLGGVQSLNPNEGMLFLYDKNTPKEQIFWMKGMFIAIDIIWVLKDKVVHIEHNVMPPKTVLATKLPTYGHGVVADKVLEFKAGFAKKNAIKVGSKFEYFLIK